MKNSRNRWVLLFLFVILLALGACTSKDNGTSAPRMGAEVPSRVETEPNQDPNDVVPSSDLVESYMDDPAKNKYVDALAIQMSEESINDLAVDTVEVIQQGSCNLSVTQPYEYALLRVQGYAHFLCIDTGDTILCHYMGDTFRHFSELSFADVDGDGRDEMIAHFYTMAARGPSNASCVLKYEDHQMKTLLYADGTNQEEEQINCPDLGFEIAFQDGYRYSITNTQTGYEKTVVAETETGPLEIIFDESGNVNTEHPLYGKDFEKDTPRKNLCLPSNFLVFQPIDVDEDGVFEIVAAQVFEQSLQSSYTLGTGYGVLKYNVETQRFEVREALYLSAGEHDFLDLDIPEQLLS